MSGAWLGAIVGSGACVALAILFHHYAVRVSNARAWLTRGALLVDVDAAGEFARHHPRVAVNIPLEDLARRAHELGTRERPLVVFAHSWLRGARATRELRALGTWEVMNAAGLYTKEKLNEAARDAEQKKTRVAAPDLAPGAW